jgi:hypothetical protein
MADIKTLSCTRVEIPKGRRLEALAIVKRVRDTAEKEDEMFSVDVTEVSGSDDLILSHGGDLCLEHLIAVISTLVHELELSPVVVQYASTTSQTVVDGFGGGAFVVARGRPIQSFDGWSMSRRYMEQVHGGRSYQPLLEYLLKRARDLSYRPLPNARIDLSQFRHDGPEAVARALMYAYGDDRQDCVALLQAAIEIGMEGG